MREPSSNEIVTYTCRHNEHFRHIDAREPVPYKGPASHCAECGNQLEEKEPVVHDDAEIICHDCHSDAYAWATVMHIGR